MLKGIHPLLHADLLHALASMGHGDELVIADANFPAASIGRRLIHAGGASAPEALDAILTVFPLDTFLRPAALTMQMVGDPAAIPESVREFGDVFARRGRAAIEFGKLEREAFYTRARNAYAVVRTGDFRPYGNILLVKGVVNAYPPAR
ncbi:MAG TPA: RbsD/FucU domain-containing protein [Casimicrobiaceae bacterium]|nr:RbsD/FucU domain-containing protein [Casimicrobiaceae bacterium]